MVPKKAVLGKAFKKEAKEVMETLSSLPPDQIATLETAINSSEGLVIHQDTKQTL